MSDRLIEEVARVEIAERARRVDDWGAGYDIGRRFGPCSRVATVVAEAAKALGKYATKSWHNGIKAGWRVRADDMHHEPCDDDPFEQPEEVSTHA